MFARVLEMKCKHGQARAQCTAIEKEVNPIIEKYPGFLQGACLIPEESPDTVLAISFWENKEAGEKFRTEGYPKVSAVYERFTEAGGIHLRKCDVAFSLFKARAAKA
jgi:heme-degrading monooxygenase HmoA